LKHKNAHSVLAQFFDQHHAVRGTIARGHITPTDLLPLGHVTPRLTRFAAHHDTWLFSKVVGVVAEHASRSGVTSITDLGAGSCIPTIRACLEHPQYTGRVTCVDIDDDALKIGAENVTTYQLAPRYTFVRNDMLDYLDRNSIATHSALVANPPFLPVPPGSDDPYFLPVDGGPDGTHYLRAILTSALPVGTLVGLEWSSLSNPAAVIGMMQAFYDVLYVQAFDIDAGIYTEAPRLRPYIEAQAARGLAVVNPPADGLMGWTFIGTVLRKKR